METMLDGSIYRGGEAEISIHDLNLPNYQYSKSQIWLENGPPSQLNSIQAGWAVHPRLYGDSVTRITTYWTGDNSHKTGCYNMQCPGFVVVSRKITLGQGFWGTSVYDKSSLTFKLQIFQDGYSGNWALKILDEVIGYWPKELFTHLNQGASLVRYGGNTFVSPDGISPPMGNGHLPVPDFKKTAHFKNILVIDSNYRRLFIESKIRSYVDVLDCFGLTYWGLVSKDSGVSFSFGGPGGDCGV